MSTTHIPMVGEPVALGDPVPLLSWSDVVITEGRPGSERVLLAPVDLQVHVEETVCLVAANAGTRTALVALLTGKRAQLYGTVRGTAYPTGRLSVEEPVSLVLGPGTGRAWVIVAADPSQAP